MPTWTVDWTRQSAGAGSIVNDSYLKFTKMESSAGQRTLVDRDQHSRGDRPAAYFLATFGPGVEHDSAANSRGDVRYPVGNWLARKGLRCVSGRSR
jgi:hypothetical protein